MTQAVVVADFLPDLEPLPASMPEPESRTMRVTIPLFLAAGWGALIACSTMFLLDEARVDRAAALERAGIAEPPAVTSADPMRVASVALPVSTGSIEAATAQVEPMPVPATPEVKTAPAVVQTVAVAAPIDALKTTVGRAEADERRDFVGTWGPNSTACSARSRRKGYLQATITEDGARAGRTECRFRNGRRDGLAWATTADCSDRGRRWTSQVRLIVDGDRLTWTSGKGPAFYVRCGRRDG